MSLFICSKTNLRRMVCFRCPSRILIIGFVFQNITKKKLISSLNRNVYTACSRLVALMWSPYLLPRNGIMDTRLFQKNLLKNLLDSYIHYKKILGI